MSQPFDDSIKVITLTIGGPLGNEVFVPSGLRTIRSATLAVSTRCAPEVSTSSASASDASVFGSVGSAKTREFAIWATVTPSCSAAAKAVRA